MNTFYGTIQGMPCQVFCYFLPYSHHLAFSIYGSEEIFFTEEEISEGVIVENVQYFDYISTSNPIYSEEDLEQESQVYIEGDLTYTDWLQGSP